MEHWICDFCYEYFSASVLDTFETGTGNRHSFQRNSCCFGAGFNLPYLPRFEHTGLQIAQVVLGVFITGFGGAIYLIANLGPGPRDGLMTGLQSLTNFPIASVRVGLEVSVVFVGWLLGGTVGLGTVLFALGIGPSVSTSLFALSFFFQKLGTE